MKVFTGSDSQFISVLNEYKRRIMKDIFDALWSTFNNGNSKGFELHLTFRPISKKVYECSVMFTQDITDDKK